MKIIITGGAGFVGLNLARRLVARGTAAGPDGRQAPIDDIILFDLTGPDERPEGLDGRVSLSMGDIADPGQVVALIDRPDVLIFHLAAVVSGGAEQNFELGMRVNLDGTLGVLEAARRVGSAPRVVFASSVAVFGGPDLPPAVGDTTKQLPQTTYGMTKAIGELLVNEYTRRGFIDGRAARLPTVIVRPGKPNLALSGFASGIFREPLAGEDFACPVAPDVRVPVIGVRTVVDGFVALSDIDGARLGEDRAVSLPSLSVSVAEMTAALARVGAGRTLGKVTIAPDAAAQKVVATRPGATEHARALALGLPADTDLDSIVRAYIEDHRPA